MPHIYDMGPTALLPLRQKACWGFFRPKNPTASAGFEPSNLGTKGQHATPRPPKPLKYIMKNYTKPWTLKLALNAKWFLLHKKNQFFDVAYCSWSTSTDTKMSSLRISKPICNRRKKRTDSNNGNFVKILISDFFRKTFLNLRDDISHFSQRF